MKKKVRGRVSIDYNTLARRGIHFCASCGARMSQHHYTGHCAKCRAKGYD